MITQRYGANASNFYVMDNEPTIYHEIHFDVHPDGTTYEEEFSILSDYGVAVKKACNKQCKVLAPSSWGWCGYFVDGHDQKLGQDYCTTGPDQKTHNNMALLPWYLQQAQALEKQLGYRVLDYLDVHYYAQAPYVTLSCDESSMDIIMNRLQAPRSLYDWSYTDPSWINDKIALIPRLKAWANEYYPGTKISLTEWNFGGDTCISSLIASTEALAIMATYGVDIAARWTVPENGSLLVNAWKAFTNYDGDGNSIYERAEDNGMGKGTYGVYTQTSNITAVTGYTFVRHDSSQILVYLFNKDLEDAQVTYKLNNGGNNMYNTNGAIDLFGINALNGLYYMGQVDKSDKPDSSSFTVSIYQWEVVLAVINIE